MDRGLLITFEGIDGSGKTTQIKKLSGYLKKSGFSTLLTREPGGTRISEEIRKIILNENYKEMDKITEMLLYNAARAQLIDEVIRPELNKGNIILCDRFVDSTIVYQGYARGIDIVKLNNLNEIVTSEIKPDITFLIEVPLKVSKERIENDGDKDRLENENDGFYEKVYDGYLELKEMYKDRYKVIDGNKDEEDVFNDIKIIIDEFTNELNKK